jgi:hypothetical protein
MLSPACSTSSARAARVSSTIGSSHISGSHELLSPREAEYFKPGSRKVRIAPFCLGAYDVGAEEIEAGTARFPPVPRKLLMRQYDDVAGRACHEVAHDTCLKISLRRHVRNLPHSSRKRKSAAVATSSSSGALPVRSTDPRAMGASDNVHEVPCALPGRRRSRSRGGPG